MVRAWLLVVVVVVENLEAPELSSLCSANFTSTGEPAHIPKYKIQNTNIHRIQIGSRIYKGSSKVGKL